jgi:hypothetical protein
VEPVPFVVVLSRLLCRCALFEASEPVVDRNQIEQRQNDDRGQPCVRYSISGYGKTLVPVLEVICAWGRAHLNRLSNANARRKGAGIFC